VTKDPAALRDMVDAWFVRPEAQAKSAIFNKAASRRKSRKRFFD
jgi:hypothetical protein